MSMLGLEKFVRPNGRPPKLTTLAVASFVMLCGSSITNFAVAAETADTADSKPNGKRWLVVYCGLTGDEGHRKRLTRSCEQLITTAESKLGVTPDHLRMLVADVEMQKSLASEISNVEICTKESIQSSALSICDSVRPNDSVWVFVLGHAHFYSSQSQFNIQGPDIDQSDFARAFDSLNCREQVFWITTPVSGFWLKPLARKNRVVISATEPSMEITGTEMPYALADLLADEGERTELIDVDKDGKLSLLDLYLATSLEVHERFIVLERLHTEHPQLDDNGDGRGTEIQTPYLPEPESNGDAEVEPDAKPAPHKLPNPIDNINLDGYASRLIPLKHAE